MGEALAAPAAPVAAQPARQGLWPLRFLNFFMADIQAGVGPFLSVFLLAHGWQSGPIGSVMTLGGVAGMLLTTPAGALVDATRHKRVYVVVCAAFTVAASVLILLSQDFWVVAASQVATAIAAAAMVPAVTGITLGIVRQKGFNKQNGENQAFNHAGNMVGAGMSGVLGRLFGLPSIFVLAAGFAAAAIGSVLMIPRRAINDHAARGVKDDDEKGEISGFKVLLRCKSLLILAAALACFHLGNAAMLPLYGLAVVSAKQGDPASFTAMTVVVAQAVMIVAALVAMRMAERHGYWAVLLISFLSLPIRGLLAGHLIVSWGVYPVQALDGIGAGLQSVAVPGLVARLMNGTGRVNVGQGAVMTVQGAGAALSPAIGGWMAESLGYGTTFTILGSFAIGSLCLWVGFGKLLKADCRAANEGKAETAAICG